MLHGRICLSLPKERTQRYKIRVHLALQSDLRNINCKCTKKQMFVLVNTIGNVPIDTVNEEINKRVQ